MDCFRPHLVLLASTHELRDQESLGVSADVVHQPCRGVLCKEDSQISVNTVVGPLKAHSDLEEGDELFPVPEFLVMLDQFFQVIRVNNDLLPAEAGHSELLGSHTGEADALPHLGYVSLLGGVVCGLVLFEHHVGLSELLIVVNTLVKNLRRHVQPGIKAAISTLLEVGLIGL